MVQKRNWISNTCPYIGRLYSVDFLVALIYWKPSNLKIFKEIIQDYKDFNDFKRFQEISRIVYTVIWTQLSLFLSKNKNKNYVRKLKFFNSKFYILVNNYD